MWEGVELVCVWEGVEPQYVWEGGRAVVLVGRG